MEENDLAGADICRVCRSEGTPDRVLFHPCICTGSIKWIHQECLTQWMRYSRKEYCELCGYRFSFMPIYSPDMPKRLPVKDIVCGLVSSIVRCVKYWLHYTLVGIAWLGVVPLSARRIYRCLFDGSIESLISMPLELFSTENIITDIFYGVFVATITLFAFIGLVWLREQILHGGGPDWLDNEDMNVNVGANDNDNNNAPLDENENPDIPLMDQNPANQNQMQDNHEPVEEAVEAAEPAANEGNWNPMDWDRAAEDLTWERLLGLDGSLVFLEHVLWVVSLNSLFILLFAFCPYQIGHAVIILLGLQKQAVASNFEGLVTTVCGYCVIGMTLIVLHHVAALLGLQKSKKMLGFCYVVVKVSLLSVVEIGVLPLICGWWLDICSLALFDATLKDRQQSFQSAPGTSMFIHWLVGMVYVYYFASFILLLREILRPGVLWFLRNLNDPDFSPIQEMIHLSILRHIRRLLASAVIFGTALLLMLWVPGKIIKYVWPSFLPYAVTMHFEAQFTEFSLLKELLLLQWVLPALLEQQHTRLWLKSAIRAWCRCVAWLLGLQSYLFGDEPNLERPQAVPPNDEAQGGELRALHNAFLRREAPNLGFQSYIKPRFLAIRIVLLIILTCESLVISSFIVLIAPVWIGRQTMDLLKTTNSLALPPLTNILANASLAADPVDGGGHELYSVACGLYMCWILLRGTQVARNIVQHIYNDWVVQGRAVLIARLQNWLWVGLRAFVACTLVFGVIPLLFGILLELVVIVPLRVPLYQTPVYFIWHDWVLGVLYTKIACAVTMMGPDWFMRAAIERAYRDGFRDLNLNFLIKELAAPTIICFGLALAIPYVVAYSIVPMMVTNVKIQNVIARRIYPCLFFVVIMIAVLTFQVRQFKRLYEHIKNDKYLVGQRLVNYEHGRREESNNSTISSVDAAN